jgi:hypothetical protein
LNFVDNSGFANAGEKPATSIISVLPALTRSKADSRENTSLSLPVQFFWDDEAIAQISLP